MKAYDLNPLGNARERAFAAWVFFLHPKEFIDGIIMEFVQRVNRDIEASMEIPNGDFIPEIEGLPGIDSDTLRLAEQARAEANHGS